MNMNKAFQELFGPVRAQEALKDRTKAFLAKETRGYTGKKAGTHKAYFYAAACACLLFMLLGGHWLYFTPVAEISIDINPSIEMGINRFDQVVFVSGFNEDGRELSASLDVKYRNYADALEQILRNDTVAALLSDNELMIITVIGADGQRSAQILSGVEACTAGQGNTYCYFARSEEAAAAHEAGLSCGKYRAFLELQILDPDVTPETVQGMTMRQIRELIDSLSADSGNGAFPYDDCGNGNHGHGGHGRRGRDGRAVN